MSVIRVVVVGGGAAGFFAAIQCAEANSGAQVKILEKGSRFLDKVRISGGGRCNVTHHCFDPREMTRRYPRGSKALIGPFQRFQARDTVAWFEGRGVTLKVEDDGRMFPVTDDSATIVDCLMTAARSAKVELVLGRGVAQISRREGGGFVVTDTQGSTMECEKVLLATGGCRALVAGQLAAALGHTIEPPVPSLFAMHIQSAWLHELAGISLEDVEVSVADTKLKERGPLLVTHLGFSGPAILRLSAWGARQLAEMDYQFRLQVNWVPQLTEETLRKEMDQRTQTQPAKTVVNSPMGGIPSRLWEQLVVASGIGRQLRWAALAKAARHQLIQKLAKTEFHVTGRSLNKDEFVTCGGVRLAEVDFKTMESKVCPGLYFAGELLDIDGITGGFNFQAAWTTGWIAGRAMAGVGSEIEKG